MEEENNVILKNDEKLSILQEPSIKYKLKEHFIVIDSGDRDCNCYPNPSFYRYELPSDYRNVVLIELIDAIVPDKNNILREPFILLKVGEITNTLLSSNRYISESFAVLKLANPVEPGYFITVDNNIFESTPKIFKTPLAKLHHFTISLLKKDGTLFDFQPPTPNDPLYQHTFTFKIITSEVSNEYLNQRNVF